MAYSDGTDLVSLENVVRRFQRFGRANKESLAELFVALFSKVTFAFSFSPLFSLLLAIHKLGGTLGERMIQLASPTTTWLGNVSF